MELINVPPVYVPFASPSVIAFAVVNAVADDADANVSVAAFPPAVTVIAPDNSSELPFHFK